ncbi:MAG: DUF2723 domain-containing protein [Myxococcaceae bacterium]|nr:DUF2723 domain-containing protein [Myxococcaceae bacterium]
MASSVGWLVAGVALVAFGLCVHPGLPGGDAGELASAACAQGLAHPPGYPLHGVLLRLAVAVPMGDVFVRLNLTSAVCTAGALGLVADLVRRWTRRVEPALLAAALVFAAPLVWQYATTVEVFALHLLLVALTGWTLVRLSHTPTAWRGRAFGLSAGLAVTHHQTALFVVVPLLLLEARRWRWWLPGVVVGFAPLLLLPVFSLTDTPYSWGDARSIDGFFTHLLRREYGTFRLASRDEGGAGALAFFEAFVRFEWEQVGLVPFGFGVPAAWYGWRRARALTVAVAAGLVGALGVFGALTNLPLDDALFREVVSRFFLLPHLVLAAVAAWSASALVTRRPRVLAVAALALVMAGVARRPGVTPGTLEGLGEALLDQPVGALVLVQGDLLSGVSRAVLACGSRPSGLRVIDQQQLTYGWYVDRLKRVMPEVVFPGARWHPRDAGAFTLQAFLEANANRPLVVCGGLKPGDPVQGAFVPEGLCERYVPVGAPFDDEAWWASARVPALVAGDFPAGSWERLAQREAWDARSRRGLFALERAIARGGDREWLERSAVVLREAVAGDPAPSAATWKNLGIAEGRLGNVSAMRRAFEAYLATAPVSDPEVEQIRALLAQPGR